MEKIKYFLKEGFRSLWVNRMMSLASVGILLICLIMLGTTILTTLNIDRFVSQLEAKNQIMVYIKSSLQQDQIPVLGDDIKAMPNIDSVEFLSKDTIYEMAKKQLSEQDVLMTGIDSSAFDCAYQVKIKDMKQYSQTVDELKKFDGVKYVSQDQGLASILNNIRSVVGIAGFWLFVILAIIALFIISNTIKLAMFSRKREINIMKFVGATDWFIRWPFLIEGLMIGLISGILALIIQGYVYSTLVLGVINMFNVASPVNYGGVMWAAVPLFILSGIVVGVVGSALSVHKYLKV